MTVSIQLVSPARGEWLKLQLPQQFHPNVSIQLVSPARGESLELQSLVVYYGSFHSISFPCERGARSLVFSSYRSSSGVSIQLVSPARGEHYPY